MWVCVGVSGWVALCTTLYKDLLSGELARVQDF